MHSRSHGKRILHQIIGCWETLTKQRISDTQHQAMATTLELLAYNKNTSLLLFYTMFLLQIDKNILLHIAPSGKAQEISCLNTRECLIISLENDGIRRIKTKMYFYHSS